MIVGGGLRSSSGAVDWGREFRGEVLGDLRSNTRTATKPLTHLRQNHRVHDVDHSVAANEVRRDDLGAVHRHTV